MNRHSLIWILVATLLSSCNAQRDASEPAPSSQADDVSVAPPADVPAGAANAAIDQGPKAETGRQQAAGQPSSESAAKDPGLGDYVSFPAVGIQLPQPEGFEEADSFHGFGQPETTSSVMAVSIPGPFSEITAGFAEGPMKARGWTLLSREDVDVDGLPAILLHLEQPVAGMVFVKWSLVFGNDQKTTMVTATFPKTLERELSIRLKSVVLGTRLDRAPPAEPGADLPFTIEGSQKLKAAPGIGKSLVYTRDGLLPAKSPKDPLFMVAPSLGKVVVGDKRQYAEKRLYQTAHTKVVAVTSTQPIAVDGIDGFESVAQAEDEQSGAPLVLYQVMLFDEGAYILIVGLVGADLSDEYLPEFKAMARSLRKKRP